MKNIIAKISVINKITQVSNQKYILTISTTKIKKNYNFFCRDDI